MSYPEVIALIDAELERLHSARALLFSPDEARTPQKGKADLLEALEQKPDTSVAEIVAQTMPEPRKIAPRQRRERRIARGRSKEATALSNSVSSGPVYVSAAAVRSKDAVKEGAAAPPQETLTPEMLTRRWLNASGN